MKGLLSRQNLPSFPEHTLLMLLHFFSWLCLLLLFMGLQPLIVVIFFFFFSDTYPDSNIPHDKIITTQQKISAIHNLWLKTLLSPVSALPNNLIFNSVYDSCFLDRHLHTLYKLYARSSYLHMRLLLLFRCASPYSMFIFEIRLYLVVAGLPA